MARLTGPQMKQLLDALLEAFDRQALGELLFFRLDRDIDQIVSAEDGHREATTKVLKKANQEGWIGDLLRAVAEERPKLPDLQALIAALLVHVEGQPSAPVAPPRPASGPPPAPRETAASPAGGTVSRPAISGKYALFGALALLVIASVVILALRLWEQRPNPTIAQAPAPTLTAAATPEDVLVITEPIRMELVRVPAGPFLMGSDKTADPSADDDELPQHTVDVAEFYIGKYEVTNAQYAVFAKATAREAPPGGKDNHPVVNVNWDDAVAFTEWLSAATGRAFRLPTEAEWEKAARGTDGRIYPWGNDWDPKRANTSDGGLGGTTPVGEYSLGGDSLYGAADMAGNVWEWTSSLYKPYQYDPNDGREDPKAEGPRVLRGGSFPNNERPARCAYRHYIHPTLRNAISGFRVGVSPGL